MSSKTKTQQTQQQTGGYSNANTFGQVVPIDTADISAMRDFKFTADPSAGFRMAQAQKGLNDSFSNPTGGYYTPQMRDAILRTGNADLETSYNQQAIQAQQDMQGKQFAQKAAVAGMTAPQIVQTGSSGTSNSSGTASGTQSTGGIGTILGPAIMGAAAF